MADPATKPEESSKIKELLDAVNASSGANKLGIKVDYAAGSMLEGSLNDLKKSAKLQVDYLGQLVGFQEQSLKDARLKSVQGDNTEGLQKNKEGIGGDLSKAGAAGLMAAAGTGGFGSIVGSLLGALDTAWLAWKAKSLLKPGKGPAGEPANARENVDAATEESRAEAKRAADARIAEAKRAADARIRAAEENALAEQKRIDLEAESKAKLAEAQRLRDEARVKANEARGERVSDRTGKRIYGAAADAQQGRLDRESRLSDLNAAEAENRATAAAQASKDAELAAQKAKIALELADAQSAKTMAQLAADDATRSASKIRVNKPPGLTKSAAALESIFAADTGETAARFGLGRLGGLALAGAEGLGTIAEVALGPEVLAAQLAAQIIFDPEALGEKIGNDDDVSGASMKELRDVIVPLFANKGNKAIPDVKKELKKFMTTFGGQDNFSDAGKTLHWLSEASDQELSNFAATVMRDSKTGTFNPKATINPKSIKNRAGMAMPLNDITNNRDRQNIDVRDRSLLTAPQASSTPPIVVMPPQSRPDGGGSNIVNSHNTQNTTVIQKNDASTSLAMGWTMLGYGFGSMPMGQ